MIAPFARRHLTERYFVDTIKLPDECGQRRIAVTAREFEATPIRRLGRLGMKRVAAQHLTRPHCTKFESGSIDGLEWATGIYIDKVTRRTPNFSGMWPLQMLRRGRSGSIRGIEQANTEGP